MGHNIMVPKITDWVLGQDVLFDTQILTVFIDNLIPNTSYPNSDTAPPLRYD